MTKNNKNFLFVVSCLLFDNQNKILITQRPAGKAMAGQWEFPGGKREAFETPEQALVRELKEELNLDVAIENLEPWRFISHHYESFQIFMPVYKCYQYSGTVTPMEGQNYAFVAVESIRNYPLVAADLALLSPIEKELNKSI